MSRSDSDNAGMGLQKLRMPAQWERHEATLLAYPFDDDLWFGHLEGVRREYDALIEAVAQGEGVLLMIPPGSKAELSPRPWFGLPQVHVLECGLDDVWVRDSGPIFMRSEGSSAGSKARDLLPPLQTLDFRFNAWGEKFFFEKDADLGRVVSEALGLVRHPVDFVFEGGSLDVNGEGLALTTEQCLLEPSRNKGWAKEAIESLILERFGLDRLIWLERGLVGDHTDGHIDTLTRFLDAQTIVTLVAEDRSHPSYDILKKNRDDLERELSRPGSPVRNLVELPIGKGIEVVDGEIIPYTYANFYWSNAGLLVPQFGDPNDERALDVLATCVKDRPVLGLSCQELVRGGGVLNCLTQQIPAQDGFSLGAALERREVLETI